MWRRQLSCEGRACARAGRGCFGERAACRIDKPKRNGPGKDRMCFVGGLADRISRHSESDIHAQPALLNEIEHCQVVRSGPATEQQRQREDRSVPGVESKPGSAGEVPSHAGGVDNPLDNVAAGRFSPRGGLPDGGLIGTRYDGWHWTFHGERSYARQQMVLLASASSNCPRPRHTEPGRAAPRFGNYVSFAPPRRDAAPARGEFQSAEPFRFGPRGSGRNQCPRRPRGGCRLAAAISAACRRRRHRAPAGGST